IDSTISNSSISGIYGQNVNSQLQSATNVIIENCTIVHNNVGVYAAATNAGNSVTIALSQSVVAYNGTGAGSGVTLGATAAVNSYGNNRFVGNGTDGGPFGAVAFK